MRFSKTSRCCSSRAIEDLNIVVEASQTSSASFTQMFIAFGLVAHALFAKVGVLRKLLSNTKNQY